MIKTNWEYEQTVKKAVQILDVDVEEREVDALDLEAGMPFCLDAIEDIDLSELEVGTSYRATVKVYRGEINPDLEKQWIEMEKDNPTLSKGIKFMKASGDPKPLFKFELISLEPL